jgi:DNA methylase/Hint domain
VVPIFECVEGCPVLEINRQGSEMGVHPAGYKQPPQPKYEMSEMTPSYSGGFSGPSGSRYGDDGGAARFFLNLEHEVPFYYTAKAAKSEKEDGLEEFGKSARANTHPCLHPDALVMTEKGYRPIKDIRVGDPVLTADGTFHEVELVTQHPYTVESLVEIRVMGTSFTSLVSDNHPYLIWRPTRERNHVVGGEVLWLRADQVTKGDYTMTPIVQGGRPEWEAPRPEDTDFWFIVGLYLAEGCPHSTNSEENHYPSFSLHEDEIALIERIKMYVAPTNIGVYPKKNHDGVLSKGVQVVAFDMELGNLCVRLCGRGAATKSIDPSVWNLPEDSLRAFVEGYFAGDGGMVRTYLQAKSVSQDLASQMRFLGEMLGYKVELQCVPAESGHIGEREFKTTSPVHVLRMSERNRIISHRKPSKPTVLEHEGGVFTLAYVKEVQRVPYVGDVLNLSVEGSHTFQTAVGMSHNTVKSVALMRYLVRMITPKGGLVLDPFAGSGSTLLAAIQEGDQYIGIEREEEYVNIARKRVGVVGERVARSTAEQDIFELMMVLGENDA